MTSEELPKGWTIATVESLVAAKADIVDGPFGSNLKTAHYTSEGPRVVRLQNIGDGRFNDEYAHISQEHYESLRKHSVRYGDVLVASLGEQLPRACLVPPNLGDAIVKADCLRIRPAAGVSPAYLMYALNAPALREEVALRIRGVGRPRINLGDVRTMSVPVPPSLEQERIVAEIERRLSHVDAAERSLKSASRRLHAARLSILRAGVAGHLTAGPQPGRSMLEECAEAGVAHTPSRTGSGWADVRLDAIATVGSGSTPKRGEARYWENGSIAWVTSGQVVGGKVSSPAEFITQAALAETSVKIWPAGTLLVAMYGEGRTRGHCAELLIDATCNQACAAIALKPQFQRAKDYLRLVLQSRYEENRVLGSGGVQENLNLGLVKSIVVSLPPFEMQAVIIEEVERRLSLVQAAEDAVQAQLRRCSALRRSILAAAFRGELVPQDPVDEPAEVLLQRIRDERAAAAQSKPVKKTSKSAGRKPRVKKETVA